VDVFKEAEMLRRVPFFGGLDAAKLKLLAFTSRALKFAPGEYLMRRGEAADSAYLILDGEAEVIGETSEGEFVVGVLRSNDLTGEMGVIRNLPRGASVRAKTRVRALRIASEVFLGLITENPECALDVMRQLSARIDASNARLASAQREVEALRRQAANSGAKSG